MLIFERLHDSHDRESFYCGNASLDYFLKHLANQFEKKNLGRSYVLVKQGETSIQGYFTIATGSIPFENVPEGRKKKVSPHLPVPVVLVGKLGVERNVQGKGFGSTLIREVFRLTANISQSVGIHAILVSAIDEKAFAFYRHHGFIPLADQKNHLFLPLDTIVKALKESEK